MWTSLITGQNQSRTRHGGGGFLVVNRERLDEGGGGGEASTSSEPLVTKLWLFSGLKSHLSTNQLLSGTFWGVGEVFFLWVISILFVTLGKCSKWWKRGCM